MIQHNHLTTAFYGTKDIRAFCTALKGALDQLLMGGIFTGDNMVTFGKSLGFLHDEKFMSAFKAHAKTRSETGLLWRIYTLSWAARKGLRLDGDFVECGCYKGISARIVCDYLDLKGSDRRFFLYDLFEHSDDMPHHYMPEHGMGLFDEVRERFAGFDNVHITKGRVPDTLSDAPERIAFLHIDMNNVDAEVGALERLFDRVSPGAAIVLDDYGWLPYADQKEAEDRFFGERGYQVLELPTGQGLVVK